MMRIYIQYTILIVKLLLAFIPPESIRPEFSVYASDKEDEVDVKLSRMIPIVPYLPLLKGNG